MFRLSSSSKSNYLSELFNRLEMPWNNKNSADGAHKTVMSYQYEIIMHVLVVKLMSIDIAKEISLALPEITRCDLARK